MASPKVRLEGKKIAEKVMDFIDMKSFDPIYEEIEKSEDYHVYIREIMKCIPTYRIIDDLDERGELYEAYKEYVDSNGPSLIKDMAKRMTNKEKLELVSELFKIPYLASPEEYGEAIAKAAREQYYR
jgi:phage/plasmid-associated DNA primase